MLIKNQIGYLLSGRAVADAERKTSQNGKDYVSIPLRVDSRRAPEGSKYKYEGEIINLSCWRDLADAALCIQKGDRLDVWVYGIDKREGQDGKTYYYATAEAMVPDLRVYLRVVQTYSNAAPMVETAAPAPLDRAPVPEADLAAQLEATDEDDLPF